MPCVELADTVVDPDLEKRICEMLLRKKGI